MRKNKVLNWVEKYQYVNLLAILIIFSGIVAGNLTRWSIWFDEAFSSYIVRFNLSEIAHYTAVDVHPPLYYWALKLWVGLFGNNEIGLRSFSLVMGIVALIGVFVLIRRLMKSPKIALAATALAAISPILIRFSHEARMYTMVLAIVIWATYFLVRASEKNASKKWWAGYGLLLAAGMLTHYFAAMAWLSHWVWRAWQKRGGNIKKFWTREWILAHVFAVVIFAAWLPTMIKQFTTVQGGFWIPELSAYTPIDYLSNTFLYLEYGKVTGWWAVLFVGLCVILGWTIYKGLKLVDKKSFDRLSIIIALAVVPPILLMIFSMPPLKSSFIDRYVMYAQIAISALAGVSAYLVISKKVKFGRWLVASLVLIMIAGIINVYYYGNYNKNSGTSIRMREVVRNINDIESGSQPIIAASPWIYYEAVPYENSKHQVFFLDEKTEYKYGSVEMLKDNDYGKIKNLEEFTKQNRYVWYLDNDPDSEVVPPVDTWKRIKNVEGYDYIDKNIKYRASLFDTQASAE